MDDWLLLKTENKILSKKREETWIVLEGEATVTINEMTFTKIKNETIHIPQSAKHRLENKHDSILKIIEIQTGIYFGEDDITRYDDDFGRI